MLVGKTGDTHRTPQQHAASSEPVFELGRCESGTSSFATNSRDAADFDRCIAAHQADVLATRREGARTIVTTSMYSDLAICASHSACSLARASAASTLQPWSVWSYSGKDAWDAGSAAVMCAMTEQGGLRVISTGRGHATIESEPGTAVEGCIRQFLPATHRLTAR
ncbi:MAG TPA: hypothetical protein VL326_34890 [Kofleriaceae bacterium]|nr:hypothetical protein [Kofleriaceae bacterium]